MRLRTSGVTLALLFCVAYAGGDGGRDGHRIDVPGVKREIELIAPPEEGAGGIPIFKWKRVDHASTYRLAVLNAEHDAIWAWQGKRTSVVLGGMAHRPKGEAGPIITPKARWSVVAHNAKGRVIAVSRLRDVSP